MEQKNDPNLAALTVAEAAQIFTQAGKKPVSEELITDALGRGAPTNDNGTINALHFVAWLTGENDDKI